MPLKEPIKAHKKSKILPDKQSPVLNINIMKLCTFSNYAAHWHKF